MWAETGAFTMPQNSKTCTNSAESIISSTFAYYYNGLHCLISKKKVNAKNVSISKQAKPTPIQYVNIMSLSA